MDLKVKCEYCKKNIDAAASRCPHCQGEFSADQLAQRKKDNKQAAIGCVGVLLLVGLIGMCSSGGSSDKPATSASEPATASQAAVAIPEQGTASKDVEAKVFAFNRAVTDAMKPCEAKAKDLTELLGQMGKGNSSVYEGFSIAKATQEACRSSEAAVGDVKIPDGLPGTGADDADKTIEACRNAMLGKQMAATTMTEIFDGEMRPSKVQEFKEQSNAAGSATLLCAAGMFSVGTATGVDVSKIKDAL